VQVAEFGNTLYLLQEVLRMFFLIPNSETISKDAVPHFCYSDKGDALEDAKAMFNKLHLDFSVEEDLLSTTFVSPTGSELAVIIQR